MSFEVPPRAFRLSGDALRAMVACDAPCMTAGDDQTVEATLAQEVNLAAEVRDLMDVDSLADVQVHSVDFQVTTNTLGVDFSAVDVYVGPANATTVADATLLGSLDPPPLRGETPVGALALVDEGRQALAGFMSDANVPFRLLVVAVLDFRAGDPVPPAGEGPVFALLLGASAEAGVTP